MFACGSAASYGLIPLFALPLKQENIAFDSVLFYRFLFTSLMIALYMRWKKESLKVRWDEVPALVVLGVTFAFSSYLLFVGYDYMAAGVASVILFTYPVFVAVIMGVFFKERITWVTCMAILLSLIGVFLLNKNENGIPVSAAGVMLVLLGALCYALYLVIINTSKKVKAMDGQKLTVYAIGFCSLFFLFKSLGEGTFAAIPSVSVGVQLVLFAFVTTVISCIFLVYAIHYIGSTLTAVLGALEPVIAVFISVTLFGEPFTRNVFTGILLVIGAVMMVILSNHIIRDTRKLRNVLLNHHR